jgi:hypothetical protein
MTLIDAIQSNLVKDALPSMDDGEAAHYVVRDTLRERDAGRRWQDIFGLDREPPADSDPMAWDPDHRLRAFVARKIVPALAREGCFRLV